MIVLLFQAVLALASGPMQPNQTVICDAPKFDQKFEKAFARCDDLGATHYYCAAISEMKDLGVARCGLKNEELVSISYYRRHGKKCGYHPKLLTAFKHSEGRLPANECYR